MAASILDVVELYDASGSAFHYVDRFGFKELGRIRNSGKVRR